MWCSPLQEPEAPLTEAGSPRWRDTPPVAPAPAAIAVPPPARSAADDDLLGRMDDAPPALGSIIRRISPLT